MNQSGGDDHGRAMLLDTGMFLVDITVYMGEGGRLGMATNVIEPSNVIDNHCIANLIGDKNLLTQIHSETTVQPEKILYPKNILISHSEL